MAQEPMGLDIIQGYAEAAGDLVPRYEALSSSELNSIIAHRLPEKAGRLIDVGAGTGRDASWFAATGYDVLAVEPVAEFRKAGASLHRSPRIEWLDDTLPNLSLALERGETFDVVMLSGVWQHLDAGQRRTAMPNLRALTAPGGLLIISLRHGPGALTRPVFQARAEDTIDTAVSNRFRLDFRQSTDSVQAQNRAAGVTWTWLVFSPVG